MSHSFEKPQTETARKVNFHDVILCGCNGRVCEGSCSEEHLRNSRTGVCISAHNPPKIRERRIQTQNDELEEYKGVFGEF
jgi:hypothetical protein